MTYTGEGRPTHRSGTEIDHIQVDAEGCGPARTVGPHAPINRLFSGPPSREDGLVAAARAANFAVEEVDILKHPVQGDILLECEQREVERANAMVARSAAIAEAVWAAGGSWILENPRSVRSKASTKSTRRCTTRTICTARCRRCRTCAE